MKSFSIVAASLIALASATPDRPRFRFTTVTETVTATVVPAGCTISSSTTTTNTAALTLNNGNAPPVATPSQRPDFNQVVTIRFERLGGETVDFNLNVGTAANDLRLNFGGDDTFIGASIASITKGNIAPEDIECTAQLGFGSDFPATFSIDEPVVFENVRPIGGGAQNVPQVSCGLKA